MTKNKKIKPVHMVVGLALSLSTAISCGSAIAQIKPTEEAAKSGFSTKSYSPYANRSFPARPLWGESHLHTGLSLDAGVFGNILRPADAWRFAKGEQ
ncbi:MAG: DUF3604 domain-containing protein, partial [Rhizobiaceae bacterium]